MSTTDGANNNAFAQEEPPKELLEVLCAKFILTAPKDALSKDKLFFLVEQAWWYYEDKVRPASAINLKHYSSYTTFAEPLFRKCEALSPLRPNLQSYLEDYRRYKQSIPVYGAILLDAAMEQVLLVRGNKSSMGWGFPRGKVNEGEAEADCAIREVLEETGYDIRSQLREADYLEVTADGKRHKLYLVTGLDPKTQEFEPHSKWEIGAYAWHRVDALPATADEASQVYMSADGVRHRFFMIHPFVGRLRKWIEKRRRQLAANSRNQLPQSLLSQPLSQGGAGTISAYGGGGGGGNGNVNAGWSVSSSTASSLLLPLRELQQQQQLQQQPSAVTMPSLPCSAASVGASAVAASSISAAASTAVPVQQQQQQSGAGRQGQGRKEQATRGRSGQEASASSVAAALQQLPQPQQQQQREGGVTGPVLQRQGSRKGAAQSSGLQRQQQQQARAAQQQQGQVEAASVPVAAGMASFRFDRERILGCFAAVA